MRFSVLDRGGWGDVAMRVQFEQDLKDCAACLMRGGSHVKTQPLAR